MTKLAFDQVVEQVKALNPAEQWRLRDLLETWLTAPAVPKTIEEIEQEMVRAGELTVPLRKPDPSAYESWTPVEIQGKPLSETIIEERR
jgi:hypothetical protein